MSWLSNLFNKGEETVQETVAPLLSFQERMLVAHRQLCLREQQASSLLSRRVYSKLRNMSTLFDTILGNVENSSELTAEDEFAIEATLTRYILEPLNIFLQLEEKEQVENGEADLILLAQYDIIESALTQRVASIQERIKNSLKTQTIFIEDQLS